MAKLRCGNRWHGNHQVPENAKIIIGTKGEGYYSGRGEGQTARVKIIETEEIIEVPYSKAVE